MEAAKESNAGTIVTVEHDAKLHFISMTVIECRNWCWLSFLHEATKSDAALNLSYCR